MHPSENPREGGTQGGAVLEDRVAREHRHLETLFEEVNRFLAGENSADAVREAFGELADELETHFDQEDRLYYPAIWGIRPELKESLSDLMARHHWFHDQLRRIADHFAHGELEGGAVLFRKVMESFHAHEHAEEELLARLGK